MSDQEPANRLYTECDSTDEDRLRPSEEIIRRLMEVDFSAESSLRKTLRDRLELRMGASPSKGWLEKLRFSLPMMESSIPVKVALVVMSLLAQILVSPGPMPAVTENIPPSWTAYAAANSSAPPATLESTAFVAYQPVPIPTPGVGILLNSASSGLQTISMQPYDLQTEAVTPRPTPLAPLTMLP